MRLLHLSLLSCIWFSAASCSVYQPENHCSQHSTESPLLRVDHIEAYDGAYSWSLLVYSDSLLGLKKGFNRIECRKRSSTRLLRSIERIESLPSGLSSIPHGEFVQVLVNGQSAIYSKDDLPLALHPLLRSLDEAFLEAFGAAVYNWPIMVDDSQGSSEMIVGET